MKITTLFTAGAMMIVLSVPLAAVAKQTFRDAGGHVCWTLQVEGIRSTYRTADGKVCGVAQKDPSGKVTYRNKEGKVRGTAQMDGGGTTTCRNAQGKVIYTVQGEKKSADMGFALFKLFE